mmetsp:Transcript_28015/g.93134  ORF Transcript_28015/g.93134 Transcript_28015/m.93134 type:complete len:334 (+) Transcript_28015:803-1804(+)
MTGGSQKSDVHLHVMALVIGEVGVVPRIVPQRDPRLAVWVVRVARTAQEADRGEHRWRRRLADRMDDVPLGTLGLSEGDVVRGDPAELETADHIERFPVAVLAHDGGRVAVRIGRDARMVEPEVVPELVHPRHRLSVAYHCEAPAVVVFSAWRRTAHVADASPVARAKFAGDKVLFMREQVRVDPQLRLCQIIGAIKLRNHDRMVVTAQALLRGMVAHHHGDGHHRRGLVQRGGTIRGEFEGVVHPASHRSRNRDAASSAPHSIVSALVVAVVWCRIGVHKAERHDRSCHGGPERSVHERACTPRRHGAGSSSDLCPRQCPCHRAATPARAEG